MESYEHAETREICLNAIRSSTQRKKTDFTTKTNEGIHKGTQRKISSRGYNEELNLKDFVPYFNVLCGKKLDLALYPMKRAQQVRLIELFIFLYRYDF